MGEGGRDLRHSWVAASSGQDPLWAGPGVSGERAHRPMRGAGAGCIAWSKCLVTVPCRCSCSMPGRPASSSSCSRRVSAAPQPPGPAGPALAASRRTFPPAAAAVTLRRLRVAARQLPLLRRASTVAAVCGRSRHWLMARFLQSEPKPRPPLSRSLPAGAGDSLKAIASGLCERIGDPDKSSMKVGGWGWGWAWRGES